MTASPQSKEARIAGIVLLALPVLFNLVLLYPETIIGELPLNDHVLHQGAAQRAADAVATGANPWDHWVSEFSLGYPLGRSYPPLPHIVTGVAQLLAKPFAAAPAVFPWLHYLLLSLLPAAVFLLAWQMELGWLGSGAAAALSMTVSGAGDMGLYGLGYGAQVWRGSGLYTQLWGLHLAIAGMTLYIRQLRTGEGRLASAALLAAACLSHLVAGFVAVVTVALLTLLPRDGVAARVRLFRLAVTGGAVVLLTAFFVVPLVVDRDFVHHSRWEAAWKWDSFGAEAILKALGSGRLLDDGRAPVLTLLLGCGLAVSLWRLAMRRVFPAAAVLAAFWLCLFFGRHTWGHLLRLFGVPGDMHIHRFQAAFELFAVLVGALAVEAVVGRLLGGGRRRRAAAVLVLATVLTPLYADRYRYLRDNIEWGMENIRLRRNEAAALQPVLRELERGMDGTAGRVHAGRAGTWGNTFRVGYVPVHGIVAQMRLAGTSFLYHSMALSGDLMAQMEENAVSDLYLFGVRYVVAPDWWQPPAGLNSRMASGRFRLWEVPDAGLFDVVDVPYAYEGPAATLYDTANAWLRSSLRTQGRYIALHPEGAPAGRYTSVLRRYEALPEAGAAWPAAGTVAAQWRKGEEYFATVTASRGAYVLFRASYASGLRAEVDGTVVMPVAVTPGFAAFPVGPGQHQVRVFYTSGPLKGVLFWMGWAGFVVLALAGAGRVGRMEEMVRSVRVGATPGWVCRLRPHVPALAILAVFALLSVRPLLRGQLVAGHDGLEYPPRLVELEQSLRVGNAFPIWAPDLSNGHGQPLFEFVPPVAYWVAAVFSLLGAGLADSLQFGMVALVVAGAVSLYGLGCGLASRGAGLLMACAYLFVPYLHVNLYVRANFMESAAMATLPMAAAALWRASRKGSRGAIVLGGLATAAFLLSHNAIALLGVPVLAGLVVAFGGREWRRVMAGAASLVLGGLLSAWFLMPALTEKTLIHIERLREGYLHYSGHFASLGQVLYSAWGFGQSVPGSGDGMSFMLGPVHVVLVALGMAGVWLARRREAVRFRVGVAALGAIMLAVWVATPFSRGLWDAWPTLQYLEFPWRALAIASLGLAVLSGFALELVPYRTLRRVALGVALAALLAANLRHADASFLTFDDAYYAPASIARLGINTATREEYEPRTVEARAAYAGTLLTAVDCGAGFGAKVLLDEPESRWVAVETAQGCAVRVNLHAYPRWVVELDGKRVEAVTEARNGTMVVRVPAGAHQLSLRLEHTTGRKVWRMVSALALLVVLGMMLRRRDGAAAGMAM